VDILDSHCHLDFESFDEDRAQVIAKAASVGVKRVINPGIDLETSRRAIALAQKYTGVYAAVGFHPYDASLVNEASLLELTELTKADKVVAIGEIGLDYYRDRTPKSAQWYAFEAQLTLAQTVNLPVIIHQRESAIDTMAMLRAWATAGTHPGLVLHAFSGDAEMAAEAVSLGFYIGIGGPLTFKNARQLPGIIQTVPLDRLLLETDAPYLTPHPHRGKRNEPAYLPLVAHTLANLFEVDITTLTEQTTHNTETLFRLPKLEPARATSVN